MQGGCTSFGSTLHCESTARDWDFGTEGWTTPPNTDQIYSWQDTLSKTLGKPVDIKNFDLFSDVIRDTRRDVFLITEDRSTTIPAKDYTRFRQVGETAYSQMEQLISQLALMNRAQADSYGVAKRVETFYTRLEEGFWKRVLQTFKVPLPSGENSHSQYLKLFSPNSPSPVPLPLMTDELSRIVEDLQKFTHYARAAYEDEFDLPLIWQKVDDLPEILAYVKCSIYFVSDTFFNQSEK